MKLRLGLKSYVIIIFILVFLSSLLVMNNFYVRHQEDFTKAYNFLRDLRLRHEGTFSDNLRKEYNETLEGIRLLQIQTKVYSSIVLLSIFCISCLVFVFLVTRFTKPLKEIPKATESIKNGDYNIFIRPSGIKELRDIAISFNEMSKELENTQQKLLISQKQMIWKDLARILTHEIKNPLTPIQLTTQRMEERFYSDIEKFKEIFPESMQLIYQEINNLQNLVTSFSSFAKDINLKPTVFDPAIAINDIIKPYMEKYDIILNLQENLRIKFDNTHFYQVITNIFQNAIESSEYDKSYFISIEKSHSYVVIKIRDQGTGIHSEDIPRIFEPYFTKKSKGTGLGLALVKKLCDANQCFVRVKSVVGEGTIFELIADDVVA